MMHFLRRRQPAFLLAHLAERVLGKKPVTDALPAPAVALFHGRVPLVFLVLSVNRFLVFLAEAAVCQPGAAGITAGPFWLFGHKIAPCKAKAPQDSPRRLQVLSALFYSNYTTGLYSLFITFTLIFSHHHVQGSFMQPEDMLQAVSHFHSDLLPAFKA